MTTPNGITPAQPVAPLVPPQVMPSPDGGVAEFMASPAPIPSGVQRQQAMAMSAPPVEAPIAQPAPVPQFPLDQPAVQQPQVEQPIPAQPAPTPLPDLQQQLDASNAQIAQFQERETAFEQQRQEVEAQRQATQQQEIMTGARQYAQQQYQQYIAAGNTEENARAWANTQAGNLYQALNYQGQQQQAAQQAQQVAQRYGINPQDIPQGMPQQAMEQFAALRSELNQVKSGQQQIARQQVQAQTFDSSIGDTAGTDPTTLLFSQLGDATKAADPNQLRFVNQYLRQYLPNI